MIQTIIGLSGRANSGKDTAFEAIRSHYAESALLAKRVAFADPLKMSAAWALGYQPETAEEAVAICNALKDMRITIAGNRDYDSWVSGREYLQFYGTEAHRGVFGEGFWVNATLPEHFADLDDKYPDVDVLVVTDVRFPNEAERILELNGEVWGINADERLGELPDTAHSSERPLDPALLACTIPNNHSLSEFSEALKKALVTV